MTSREHETQLQSLLTMAHHEYGKMLKKYAFIKTHNLEVSEDLVQDTFFKTWKYLVRGGHINKMKAFLYHILNNLIVDEYRKRKIISLDYLLEKGLEVGTDQTDKMIDALDSKEVAPLIEQLSPAYQKVLRMRYLESRSLKEISTITHQSTNTVAVQVHRGLAKLKTLYSHPLFLVSTH